MHRVLKAYRSRTDFLDAVHEKVARRQEKVRNVVEAAQSMQEQNLPIWRASQVKDIVQRDDDLTVSDGFVAQVLRHHLKMRFRKVKRTPFAGNMDKSLALRHLCAKQMIKLMEAGKRLVNIDESWLSDTDLRRCKWRAQG